MSNQEKLLKKIKEKKIRVAVIGLGYVGLPLAILLAKKRFNVNGYTKTEKEATLIRGGFSRIGMDKEFKKVLQTGRLQVHSIKTKKLQDDEVYIICVPTPIDKNKKPDLSILKQIAKKLSKINLEGKLIINESTVAPFTTRKIFGSLGKNYFLVCSPERIDPGSNKTLENIPKLIAGINSDSLSLAVSLYKQILKNKLVIVKNMEVVEMSKMLENTYRAVNIALVNEFAKLADKIDINILDVISAAKTKWSFQAHYPGIGVGGHCIPVDPHYILELARAKRVNMQITTDGLAENESMPEYFGQKIIDNYKKGMKILIYGLTYKKDITDLRESPVIALCQFLKKRKIPFTVYDPLLDEKHIKKLGFRIGKKRQVGIFVVGTDHKTLALDYQLMVNDRTIVIDGKNYFKNKVGKKVLGVGWSYEE